MKAEVCWSRGRIEAEESWSRGGLSQRCAGGLVGELKAGVYWGWGIWRQRYVAGRN